MLLPLTLRTESDELSEKIELFIQQTLDRKKDSNLSPEMRQFIPSNSTAKKLTPSKERAQSYLQIEEIAQSSIKRITSKTLNQLKLMIKPQQKIVSLSCSLLSLVAGIDSNVPSELLTKSDVVWPDIHRCFQHVNTILQTFSRFKEFLRMRKISLLHYKVSKTLLQRANEQQIEENRQQQSIVALLTEVLQAVHLYIKESYHPSYLKQKRSRSSLQSSPESLMLGQLSVYQIPQEVTQLQQQSEEEDAVRQPQNISQERSAKRTALKDGHYLSSSLNSQRSSVSGSNSTKRRQSSKRKVTLQTRVQLAQQQKQSRLDKILGLRVKKPLVVSHFKRQNTSNSDSDDQAKRLSERDIYQMEIERNKQEIKLLQREEINFKWQIEREVKQLRKVENKSKLMDDIARYQLIHEREKLDRQCQRIVKTEKTPLSSCKSATKLTLRDKENFGSVRSNMVQQSEDSGSTFVNELKRELLNSQRTKEQLTESLLRTLSFSNSSCTIKRQRQDLIENYE